MSIQTLSRQEVVDLLDKWAGEEARVCLLVSFLEIGSQVDALKSGIAVTFYGKLVKPAANGYCIRSEVDGNPTFEGVLIPSALPGPFRFVSGPNAQTLDLGPIGGHGGLWAAMARAPSGKLEDLALLSREWIH